MQSNKKTLRDFLNKNFSEKEIEQMHTILLQDDDIRDLFAEELKLLIEEEYEQLYKTRPCQVQLEIKSDKDFVLRLGHQDGKACYQGPIPSNAKSVILKNEDELPLLYLDLDLERKFQIYTQQSQPLKQSIVSFSLTKQESDGWSLFLECPVQSAEAKLPLLQHLQLMLTSTIWRIIPKTASSFYEEKHFPLGEFGKRYKNGEVKVFLKWNEEQKGFCMGWKANVIPEEKWKLEIFDGSRTRLLFSATFKPRLQGESSFISEKELGQDPLTQEFYVQFFPI